MKEIYCTNCYTDITIDDDDSYTICPVCGKALVDPDDSDFDSNVIWICDNCGACLNKQSGFDDFYSTWTCCECGFENSLSEDDIYESEFEYQRKMELSEDDEENDDEYDDDEDDDEYYEDDEDTFGSYTKLYVNGNKQNHVGKTESGKGARIRFNVRDKINQFLFILGTIAIIMAIFYYIFIVLN